MAKNALYNRKREIRPFAELAHGVDVLIEKTEQEPKGSFYTAMSALLLTAFTFEAYLNHLGWKKIETWNKNDRTSVLNKYGKLCEYFQLHPNYASRPYQTLKQLFRYRDTIVHGKSEVLYIRDKRVNVDYEPPFLSPQAHWEECSTLENAKRVKQDVWEIITELHKSAGLGNHPFIAGPSSGSLSYLHTIANENG